MKNLELQLYDSVFFHRKSHCLLIADIRATLLNAASLSSCQNTDHSEFLTSRSCWIPKAQSFNLSLHLSFHKNINHVCDCGTPAADIIADSIGAAEVS